MRYRDDPTGASAVWSPPFDVVVVAASAGGVAAVKCLLGMVPAEPPAAFVVVQHRAAAPDVLVHVLRRATGHDVRPARDGDVLHRGVVTVAPARGRLTVEPGGVLRMADDPAEACRADPLLESVAPLYGPRGIAVVLSGRLHDGARGARAVKQHGGRVLVQHPLDAASRAMPDACLATGAADFALPIESLGHAVTALVTSTVAAELFRVPMPAWAS